MLALTDEQERLENCLHTRLPENDRVIKQFGGKPSEKVPRSPSAYARKFHRDLWNILAALHDTFHLLNADRDLNPPLRDVYLRWRVSSGQPSPQNDRVKDWWAFSKNWCRIVEICALRNDCRMRTRLWCSLFNRQLNDCFFPNWNWNIIVDNKIFLKEKLTYKNND